MSSATSQPAGRKTLPADWIWDGLLTGVGVNLLSYALELKDTFEKRPPLYVFVSAYWYLGVGAAGLWVASRRFRGLPWGSGDIRCVIVSVLLGIVGVALPLLGRAAGYSP